MGLNKRLIDKRSYVDTIKTQLYCYYNNYQPFVDAFLKLADSTKPLPGAKDVFKALGLLNTKRGTDNHGLEDSFVDYWGADSLLKDYILFERRWFDEHKDIAVSKKKLTKAKSKKILDNFLIFGDKWGLNSKSCFFDLYFSIKNWQRLTERSPKHKLILGACPNLSLSQKYRVKLSEQAFEWDHDNDQTLGNFKKEIITKVSKAIDSQINEIRAKASTAGVVIQKKTDLDKHIKWLYEKQALGRSWPDIAKINKIGNTETARSAVYALAKIIDVQVRKKKAGRPRGSKDNPKTLRQLK